MIKIKFGLLSVDGNSVVGVAKVILPFSIEIDFEKLDLKDKDIGEEELKSFLKSQIEVEAKNIVKNCIFVYSSENYPGQVCLN